jgi:hypothetical protein
MLEYIPYVRRYVNKSDRTRNSLDCRDCDFGFDCRDRDIAPPTSDLTVARPTELPEERGWRKEREKEWGLSFAHEFS